MLFCGRGADGPNRRRRVLKEGGRKGNGAFRFSQKRKGGEITKEKAPMLLLEKGKGGGGGWVKKFLFVSGQ